VNPEDNPWKKLKVINMKKLLQMCLWNDCGDWEMRENRCSKPIKKPVIFKISWPFHGN